MKHLSFLLLLFAFQTYSQVESYPAKKSYGGIQLITTAEHPNTINSTERTSGEVLYEDDFSVASNWTMTALLETANWEIVTEEPTVVNDYVGTMASTTEANGFALFNGIQYLVHGTVTPQNATLTFNTTLNCLDVENVTLEFEQRYRHFYYEQTWVEVSDNDGVSYDYTYAINSDAVSNAPSTQNLERINITAAAAGKEFVKIRFRWISTEGGLDFGSGYAWMIDDFKVRDSWYYDQKILTTYHRSGIGGYMPNGLDYYQISSSQVTEIIFSGITENMGGQVQENAKLNVEITGPIGYSGTSTGIDLPILAIDSMACSSSFIPTLEGNYQLKYWFDCDSTEEYTLNDTLYSSFKRTAAEYGRANAITSGFFQNIEGNEGNPVLIGNVMEIFSAQDFCEIRVGISNSPNNIGKNIYGKVYVYDETAMNFVYLQESSDHTISAAENGGFASMHTPTMYFEEGQTILVLVGHYGGASDVEFRMAQKVEEQSVLGFLPGETIPFYLENPNAMMVSLDFPDCEDITEEVYNPTFELVENQPNPCNETTVISYSLQEQNQVTFNLYDALGNVIKTMNLGQETTGFHYFELNTSDLNEGVYFYTLTVGDQSQTKRMVVTK